MKRILLFIFTIGVFSINAQDLTSKKGENYLPESGDWAIGFDATSFLNYAGNLFNAGAVAPQAAEPIIPLTVYGKLFTDDNQAFRATLGINMGSNTESNGSEPGLDAGGFLTGSDVNNEIKTSTSFYAFGFGKEFRRGNTRLQGVYGAEAMLLLSSSKTTYTYGNSIASIGESIGDDASRVTEMKDPSSFGVILRAFIGAEYFIAPKISITAEYGWGFGFTSTSGSTTTTESYDWDDMTTSSDSNQGEGSSSFNISNELGIANGMLGLMLHF